MSLRRVVDVAGAEKYIRAQLSDGNTLAHLVLNNVDFGRGSFRIAIPDSFDQSQLTDFGSGNLRLAGDEEMTVARLIKAFISNPNSAFLMQETQLDKADPFFVQNGYEKFVVGYKNEMYWRLAEPELKSPSDELMLTLLRSSSYYPFSGFFHLARVYRMPFSKTLTDSDLEQILTGLVGLAVDALDSRSFLIWWREDLSQFPS